MPPTEAANPVSSSGITVDSTTGEHYIPSSLRADGSRRREIRIRPGYKPPEDIQIYKARAALAWRNREKAGTDSSAVPGSEGLGSSKSNLSTTQTQNGTINTNDSNVIGNNKNAKRRENRRKAKAVANADEAGDVDADAGPEKNQVSKLVTENKKTNIKELDNWRSSATSNNVKGDDSKKTQQPQQPQKPAVDTEAENEKKARNLKKKLRQARELGDKKDRGESLLPDQLGKVIKIQELTRQLELLGIDSNSDKKETQKLDEKE